MRALRAAWRGARVRGSVLRVVPACWYVVQLLTGHGVLSRTVVGPCFAGVLRLHNSGRPAEVCGYACSAARPCMRARHTGTARAAAGAQNNSSVALGVCACLRGSCARARVGGCGPRVLCAFTECMCRWPRGASRCNAATFPSVSWLLAGGCWPTWSARWQLPAGGHRYGQAATAPTGAFKPSPAREREDERCEGRRCEVVARDGVGCGRVLCTGPSRSPACCGATSIVLGGPGCRRCISRIRRWPVWPRLRAQCCAAVAALADGTRRGGAPGRARAPDLLRRPLRHPRQRACRRVRGQLRMAFRRRSWGAEAVQTLRRERAALLAAPTQHTQLNR